MEILSLIGIVAAIVTIIAGIVQVLQYLQERQKKSGALSQLGQILTKRFDERELRILCSVLEIEYDNLPGEEKANKVRKLIANLKHQNRISELVGTGKRLRPDISWDAVTQEFPIGDAYVAPSPQPKLIPPPKPLRPPDVAGFIGREAELAYFAEKLATFHLVVITGMAGVGKTALAARLAQQVAGSDQIFWHAFHKGEGIDAIIWKLAGFLAWHGQEDLWHMLQRAQQTSAQPPPTEMLFDYLIQMSCGRDYLLCFDDFQFVDDDPLLAQLVDRLRKAVAAGELSLIITSRRVPAFVQMVEFEPLRGLSTDDTRLLLTSRGLSLPDDLAADLHSRTEGNAQFLTLAIDALRHDRDSRHLVAHLSETDDVKRYLMTEVDRGLTEVERAVMGALAVLMDYAGTRDAIEAILDRGGLQRTLNELYHRHLLTVTAGEAGREYSQHAIVRTFYYHLLGRRKQQAMHHRAGEYYETEEPEALRAARHFYEAGEHERAAKQATKDVWALINEGQARPLRHLLERFTMQQLDTALRAAVNIARGQVYMLLGEGQAAKESYEEALSELAALPESREVSELRARAYVDMGDLLHRKSLQEALDCLRRGLGDLAEASISLQADLHIKIGSVQTSLGNHAAALRALDRGLELLSEEGPSRLRARALNNLGTIYCIQGDIEQGKDCYLRALEIDQQLHDYWGMVETWHNLGIELEIAGHWADAGTQYQRALVEAERLGSPHQRVREELALGILKTNQGDYQAAETHLSNCLEIARDHGLQTHLTHIQPSLADLHLRQGEAEAAQPLLVEAEQLALEAGVRKQLPEIYRLWAQVHLALGRPQAALPRAEQSVSLACDVRDGREEGMSLRVLGQALLTSDQPEQAVAAFEVSLSLLTNHDPYEAARTKAQWGLSLISSGDADRGIGLLRQAETAFQELGAQGDLAVVHDVLRSDS
jgi:tetratricopeptide (TPR) repeat protein